MRVGLLEVIESMHSDLAIIIEIDQLIDMFERTSVMFRYEMTVGALDNKLSNKNILQNFKTQILYIHFCIYFSKISCIVIAL